MYSLYWNCGASQQLPNSYPTAPQQLPSNNKIMDTMRSPEKACGCNILNSVIFRFFKGNRQWTNVYHLQTLFYPKECWNGLIWKMYEPPLPMVRQPPYLFGWERENARWQDRPSSQWLYPWKNLPRFSDSWPRGSSACTPSSLVRYRRTQCNDRMWFCSRVNPLFQGISGF